MGQEAELAHAVSRLPEARRANIVRPVRGGVASGYPAADLVRGSAANVQENEGWDLGVTYGGVRGVICY